jgi:hypothetical protein
VEGRRDISSETQLPGADIDALSFSLFSSRRSPAAAIEPSGKASAAAIPSRSGVSGLIWSGGGIAARAQPISAHHSTLHFPFTLITEQQVVVTSEVELLTGDLFQFDLKSPGQSLNGRPSRTSP